MVIDFLGRVDGVEFAGGKAENYELTLGSGTFIPGFEEQLTGIKVGAKTEVKVKFPENYGAAELSGKDAVFDVTVHEIKAVAPAAIDDELAKKLGGENLDALRESIKEEQEREFLTMSRMTLKRELLDKLADAHDFKVPKKLLEREFEAIWTQYQEEQNKAGDDVETATPKDQKPDVEGEKEFREIAERRVRLGLLMAEVGRSNDVQINQEDVNRQLMEEARRDPSREQEIMEHYRNTPEAMEQLSAPIYEEKVVDFILEQATVTDKKATMDDLIKAMDTDDDGKLKAKGKAKSDKKPAKKSAKKPAKKAAKK